MQTWRIPIAFFLLISSPVLATEYEVPFFMGVGNQAFKSVLRIQGAYPQSMPEQTIQILGYDDRGDTYGPVDLYVSERRPAQLVLTSEDIENGNPDKGLDEGLGDGHGDWRLKLTSNDEHLDIRAYAVNKVGGGVVVPLHQLSSTRYFANNNPPRTAHFVALLTAPGSTMQSHLRVFNRSDQRASIRFVQIGSGRGKTLTIDPYSAMVRTASEVSELLNALDLKGDSFAEGWSISVTSEQDIGVMVVVTDGAGNVANLSGPPAAIIGDGRPPRDSQGSFHITLDFGDGFSEEWRSAIRYAADRWEQIIVADYPLSTPSGCNISTTGQVDDIIIRFEWETLSPSHSLGAARVCSTVSTSGFPGQRTNGGKVSLQALDGVWDREGPSDPFFADLVLLHEIGHVVGIGSGSSWQNSGWIVRGTRPHFTGPNATAQFQRLQRSRYDSALARGVNGVPLENDGVHWRTSAYAVDSPVATYTVHDDLMAMLDRIAFNKITAITVGALDDIGYQVDYTQVE